MEKNNQIRAVKDIGLQMIKNGYLVTPTKKRDKFAILEGGEKKGEKGKKRDFTAVGPYDLKKAVYKVKNIRTGQGLGLFLGGLYGVCVVDCDFDFDVAAKHYSDEIARLLSKKVDDFNSKWKQQIDLAPRTKGAKGYKAFFRMPPELLSESNKWPTHKAFIPSQKQLTEAYKTPKQVMIIEVLCGGHCELDGHAEAAGLYAVTPPTIHPKTKKPYVWLSDKTLENTVAKDLPFLPVGLIEDVKKLRDDCVELLPDNLKQYAPKKGSSTVGLSSVGQIDAGTMITLNSGKQVSLFEAIEKHNGEYCFDPFEPEKGQSKAIIKQYGIFSFLHGSKRYTLPEFFIPAELSEYFEHKHDQNYEASSLQVALFEGYTKFRELQRNPEYTVKEYFKSNYPTLNAEDLDCICGLVAGLNSKFKSNAKSLVDLTPQNYNSLHITADKKGHIDWTKASQKIEDMRRAGVKRVLVVNASQMGTGKTECFFPEMMTPFKNILVTNARIATCQDLFNRIGRDNDLLWYDDIKANFVPSGTYNRVVSCLPSLINQSVSRMAKPELFIIDEATQVLDEIAENDLIKASDREHLFEEFQKRLKESVMTCVADADMSDKDVEAYQKLGGFKDSEVLVITTTSNKAQRKMNLIYNTHHKEAQKLFKSMIQACDGTTACFFESRDKLEALTADMQETSFCCISGDDSEKSTALKSAFAHDYVGVMRDYQHLAFTGTIGRGRSLNDEQRIFKNMVASLSGCSDSALNGLQSTVRVRYLNESTVLVNRYRGLNFVDRSPAWGGYDVSSYENMMLSVQQKKACHKALFVEVLELSLQRNNVDYNWSIAKACGVEVSVSTADIRAARALDIANANNIQVFVKKPVSDHHKLSNQKLEAAQVLDIPCEQLTYEQILNYISNKQILRLKAKIDGNLSTSLALAPHVEILRKLRVMISNRLEKIHDKETQDEIIKFIVKYQSSILMLGAIDGRAAARGAISGKNKKLSVIKSFWRCIGGDNDAFKKSHTSKPRKKQDQINSDMLRFIEYIKSDLSIADIQAATGLSRDQVRLRKKRALSLMNDGTLRRGISEKSVINSIRHNDAFNKNPTPQNDITQQVKCVITTHTNDTFGVIFEKMPLDFIGALKEIKKRKKYNIVKLQEITPSNPNGAWQRAYTYPDYRKEMQALQEMQKQEEAEFFSGDRKALLFQPINISELLLDERKNFKTS